MNIRFLLRLSGFLSIALVAMGMSGGQGCQPNILPDPPGAGLEGLWTLNRGKIDVKITWPSGGGGEHQSQTNSGMLETLDPAAFPTEIKPLVDQWNTGIGELNARLNEAFPQVVALTFPRYGVMKLVNPDQPERAGVGAINSEASYFFLGDLAGTGGAADQGAGAVLSAATINGTFNVNELTTEGNLARTLVLVLSGTNQTGVSFTAKITVEYSGQRTGDIPPDVAAQIAADPTFGG